MFFTTSTVLALGVFASSLAGIVNSAPTGTQPAELLGKLFTLPNSCVAEMANNVDLCPRPLLMHNEQFTNCLDEIEQACVQFQGSATSKAEMKAKYVEIGNKYTKMAEFVDYGQVIGHERRGADDSLPLPPDPLPFPPELKPLPASNITYGRCYTNITDNLDVCPFDFQNQNKHFASCMKDIEATCESAYNSTVPTNKDEMRAKYVLIGQKHTMMAKAEDDNEFNSARNHRRDVVEDKQVCFEGETVSRKCLVDLKEEIEEMQKHMHVPQKWLDNMAAIEKFEENEIKYAKGDAEMARLKHLTKATERLTNAFKRPERWIHTLDAVKLTIGTKLNETKQY